VSQRLLPAMEWVREMKTVKVPPKRVKKASTIGAAHANGSSFGLALDDECPADIASVEAC